MRVREVARRFGLDKSTASRLLRRLEEQGLVGSVPDEEDGRSALLRITPGGRALLGRTREERLHFLRRLFASWEEEERDQLRRLAVLTPDQDFTQAIVKANARYLTSLGFSFEYLSQSDVGTDGSRGGGGDVRVIEHGFYHSFIIKTLVQQSSVCWQLGKKRTADGWRRIAENSMEIITGHRKLFRDGYAKVYESLKWSL